MIPAIFFGKSAVGVIVRKGALCSLAAAGAFFFSVANADAVVLPADLALCPDPVAPAAVRGTIASATLGEQISFLVEASFDQTGRTQVTATLRAMGTRSLVYVEDAYYASLSSSGQAALLAAAADLQQEFDNTIYPGLTVFYGAPWEPGIDGDVRITILLTRLTQTAGGYTDTTDEFPKVQAPASNEREMIYLNAFFASQQERLRAFAAHEFTHLIDFNQKQKVLGVEEEVWLNELRAEYAPTHLGYDTPYNTSNLSSRVSAFLASPHESVTEWKNEAADYGIVNLFGQYIAGRYGESVLGTSMKTASQGIAALDVGFAAVGSADRFADVFQNFAIANYVNSALAGAVYAYAQQDLSASTLKVGSPTFSAAVGPSATVNAVRQVEDWAGQWIQAVPTGADQESLVITMSSPTPIYAKVLLVKADGGQEVRAMAPSSGGATLTIAQATTYREITVVPALAGKTSGFSTGSESGSYPDEPLRTYTVVFQRIASTGPLFTSASPAQILPFGGVMVTLKGFGFSTGAVSVALDGQSVAATVVDDETLRFIAPAHATGAACVRLTAGSVTNERCDILSYVAFADGALLRGEGFPEVWIINERFRRHIVRSDIFGFYPHLSWNAVQVVSSDLLTQLRVSAWVRAPLTADPVTWRVYEVNGDATKHWITCANPDNCGSTWIAHGGDPSGISTVNQRELDFYTAGSNVFLQ